MKTFYSFGDGIHRRRDGRDKPITDVWLLPVTGELAILDPDTNTVWGRQIGPGMRYSHKKIGDGPTFTDKKFYQEIVFSEKNEGQMFPNFLWTVKLDYGRSEPVTVEPVKKYRSIDD